MFTLKNVHKKVLEVIDTQPTVNVRDEEYHRLLGYPKDYEPNQRSQELSESSRQWYAEHGSPWVYARQVNSLVLKEKDRIILDGMEFNSPRLHNILSKAMAHSAVIVAVSAGKECEEKAAQYWQENKPDEYFFMEMYGSAVVENLVANTAVRFCAWADSNNMAVLPHYSPGYPDWDISEQSRLMELILKGSTHFPGNIRVLQTGMLKPKKSLLAVYGITQHVENTVRLTDMIPCESCSLPACKYRRKPYVRTMIQVEDVNKLQSNIMDQLTDLQEQNNAVLDVNANYTLGKKVLQKWSEERLKLHFTANGIVEASFRYDGTTCSNMGMPLTFNYFITLSPKEENYRILKTKCIPAPNDTGHKCMCEYTRHHQVFISNIANEKPLISKPLNDVLTWERRNTPTGCYCDPNGRMHKWGIVYEVLHYALVNHKNGEA